jgi:hypothetical protein
MHRDVLYSIQKPFGRLPGKNGSGYGKRTQKAPALFRARAKP